MEMNIRIFERLKRFGMRLALVLSFFPSLGSASQGECLFAWTSYIGRSSVEVTYDRDSGLKQTITCESKLKCYRGLLPSQAQLSCENHCINQSNFRIPVKQCYQECYQHYTSERCAYRWECSDGYLISYDQRTNLFDLGGRTKKSLLCNQR